MGGSIFKDKEEQLNKGPVFNVSASRNADVEEELERRRRRREEQERWMMNAPENNPAGAQKANVNKSNEENKIYPDQETAEKELLKAYFKIDEPVLPWSDEQYPEFSKELNDTLKATLQDNGRMSKSHFGLLRESISRLAGAGSNELRVYYLDMVFATVNDYIKRSTSKTNKKRLERAHKLKSLIRDHKRVMLSWQEKVEKAMAGVDKDLLPVLRSLQAVESLKTDRIRPYPGDDDPAKLEKYRKEISGMGVMFAMQYNKLISSCDVFLSKDRKPKAVKLHYEKIKQQAEDELKLFNNALTDFLSTSRTRKEITWGDALLSRTNNYVSLDTGKEKNVGAGTSDVYKIKRGTSDFDYFKEEENIGKNNEDCWDIVSKKYAQKKLSNKEKEALKRIDEALRNDLKKLDEVKDPEKKLSLKMTFYRNFVVFDHRYRDYFIRLGMGDSETVRDATRDAEYETFELLKNCAHIQPELLDHMSKILGIFIKNYNCFYMATKGAKIKEGSNLSGRNVATYRMAVALGIEDCVARSETAKVRRNDKLVYGNLMEEAKGSEALKMGKQKDKKYTSKCVCDIAMMQVFDLICGQIDRNGRNYYVNATAENIDSIKMIDNDLAFGNLSADELMNGYQSMPKFMDALILALPDHFKRRVLEMDKKTISLMLEDILTTEEIEAASKRLDIVKAKIRLIQNGLDDKKKSEKSEDRFEEYCLGFEEYRALNYQLSILDAFKTENERFRKKERKTKPVLERYTYLRQNNMLSEKEIIDRMKKFKEKHKKDKWDGR